MTLTALIDQRIDVAFAPLRRMLHDLKTSARGPAPVTDECDAPDREDAAFNSQAEKRTHP